MLQETNGPQYYSESGASVAVESHSSSPLPNSLPLRPRAGGQPQPGQQVLIQWKSDDNVGVVRQSVLLSKAALGLGLIRSDTYEDWRLTASPHP